MRILHVLHQLLAIHEQFLTLRTIDSVGATDQGSVLWGRDITEVKFLYVSAANVSFSSIPHFLTSLTFIHFIPPSSFFLQL